MQNQPTTDIYEVAKQYLPQFHVLAVRHTDKHPRYSWQRFQEEKPTTDDLLYQIEHHKGNALVAVTGKVPGYFVIDVDPGAKIDVSKFPETLTAVTGRDGRHYYFKYPSEFEIKTVAGWKPNVDVRGRGGLVKMPPSQHKNGNYYQWVDESTPIAEAPQWLLDELPKAGDKYEKMDTSIFSKEVNEGGRNGTLIKMTGKLLKHLPEEDWVSVALPALHAINLINFMPPLTKGEVESCYYSIANSEKRARENGASKEPKEKMPQLEVLLEILRNETDLFLNQFGQACYKQKKKMYVESLPSTTLDRKLIRDYYQTTGEAPAPLSLKQAVNIFHGELENSEEKRIEVHTRIGRFKDSLIYDIGDGKNFIEINHDEWKMIENPPIMFERQQSQLPQALPNGEQADLTTLFQFINITKPSDQLLLLVYLVCAFIPDIPRPILNSSGEQGSAKTTALKIIRSLVDPANPAMVSLPNDPREFVQMASHNYMLLLDNLTYLKDWQSDALCRFITGDGFSKRALFTNNEDFLYSFMRVIGLSGINQIATKADLLDRALIIKFERLESSNRVTERQLWKRFEELKPTLFSTLLTVVAKTLSVVDSIQLKNPNRLADFHQYAAAAAHSMGFTIEQLDDALKTNTDRQNREALEASGVAKTIVRLMDGRQEYTASSTELFNELKFIAQQELSTNQFPKGSNWLWKKIVEVRPNLQEVGIICQRDDTKSAHSIITIKNDGSHIPNTGQENSAVDDPFFELD